MGFSFFVSHNKGAQLIRGIQVAGRLGGKINPTKGFDNDVCIHVKRIRGEYWKPNHYIDIVDNIRLLQKLRKAPRKIKIIVLSEIAKKRVCDVLPWSEVFVIPQHHCNYERKKRSRREVKNVGYIGSGGGFVLDFDEMKKEFEKIGLNFFFQWRGKSRESVASFLGKLDISVAFRRKRRMKLLKDSLKIYNPGSFGIPTAAFPTQAYNEEFDGCFLPARTKEELLSCCKALKEDENMYANLSRRVAERSEKHHIDNVIKYYEQLERTSNV